MTLKQSIENQKCRKGESAGRSKKGAYWIAGVVRTSSYGQDGIGQNSADVDWSLMFRHYRNGDVSAVLVRDSWHQNYGHDYTYQSCPEILDMETIDDVLDHLSGIVGSKDEMYFPEYSERVYVDSSYREPVTELLTSLGLPRSTAPDEQDAYDYGYAFGEWLMKNEPDNAIIQNNPDADIPEGDYLTMKDRRVNPDPDDYWEGYNRAIIEPID